MSCDLGLLACHRAAGKCWRRFRTTRHYPSAGSATALGRLYVDCHERGDLILAGARAVDLDQLLRAALDLFGSPVALAADRWRDAELRDVLDKAGVPPASLISRGQGFKDGAEDVRDFRRACLEGRVTAAPSLLLRYAISPRRASSWTRARTPSWRNRVRVDAGRRARDDAAAAAIMAVAAGSRKAAKPARRRRHAVTG